MLLEQKFCFTHTTGEDIFLFTLRNAQGTEVSITNYGAIICSFKVKNKDNIVNDIVLGFDKVEDYLSPEYQKQRPCFGSAIGRYANRIQNATFKIDGRQYLLSKNHGNNQLHGGDNGLDKKVWQLVDTGQAPCPFVVLKYISQDGEEGFPGNLEIFVRFELNNNNELSYEYKATCDQATAVNLTHHSYFNLNEKEETFKEQYVKIYSSFVLDQDEDLSANGSLSTVEETPFDLTDFRSINKQLELISEYDKSFLINDKEKNNSLSLVAEAKSLSSKLLLQVFSTEPVVHFYTGKWIPPIKGKNGKQYGPFSGFCLETQIHPNAVNIPHFPNTILRPGETYYQKTIYKLVNA
jgi:aldose 1-epimerase